jgi:hypothetical protein
MIEHSPIRRGDFFPHRICPVDSPDKADILKKLESGNRDVAVDAIRHLADQGPEAAYAVHSLIHLFRGGDGELRIEIIDALIRIGPAARQAGPVLFDALKGTDKALRRNAANAFRELFGIQNIDYNQILGYDDYDSFITSHPPAYPLPEIPPEPLTPSQPRDAATAAALRSAAANWPEDVGQRAEALAAEHLAYREEYAVQLGPIIEEQIKQAIRDGADSGQKKDLIKAINEKLRLGGVAIRFEVRNQSSDLTAELPGYLVIGTSRDGKGRFRVETQAEGERQSYGLTEESSPITLMPAPAQHNVQLDGPGAESHAGRVKSHRSTQAISQRR